jgi:NAD(P)-dependent dehydrogenase (short-subunit alcohol dehydrogenase family)
LRRAVVTGGASGIGRAVTERLVADGIEVVAADIDPCPLTWRWTSPAGSPTSAAEVAELVAWLASDRCSFSIGAVYDISGGRATY